MPSATAPDVLAAILGATRRIVEIRRASVPESALERDAVAAPRAASRFTDALSAPGRLRVIAECKRRSPSRGVLRAKYDPVAIARGYEAAGASAVSVLTEPTFFDGAPEHLRAVRAAVSLPILRKDFIVDRYQVLEAVAWGADAVLLIAAALDDRELESLLHVCRERRVDALVEVHDRAELQRALDAGAAIVGVNNRNLRTLGMDGSTAEDLVSAIPDCALAVAESGLRTAGDLERLAAMGYDAFLIGERLVCAPDPGGALAELLA
ncbi:MAG TPA: indole-3-glycerol phosphate synthase TrpC [Vicinamibacterales bacterium]|nr:indole-3-glycerol phosphate synthase TrpC [Vicinamibacterales bacterium]